MAESYYWTKDDVADLIKCSDSKAYKMISKWNTELQGKGYDTIRGRIPRQYAIDRLGLEARGN